MARTIADALMAGDAQPTDRDERVRAQRELLAGMEVPSPAGVDEDIAGVPCRVFRPIVPPKAVYLHFHGGAMILGSPLMNDVATPISPSGSASRWCRSTTAWHPSTRSRRAPTTASRWRRGWSSTPKRGSAPATCWSAASRPAATSPRSRCCAYVTSSARSTASDGANLVFGVYDLGGTPATHGFRPSDAPDILDLDTFAFVHECYLPGRTPRRGADPRDLAAVRRPAGPPARALHRRQRRPPARRQPVHGGPVGGVRQRGGARGVSRLRARLHRRSPWSWRSGRTSGSTTSSCERPAERDGRRARRRRDDRPLPRARRRGARTGASAGRRRGATTVRGAGPARLPGLRHHRRRRPGSSPTASSPCASS